MTRMIFVNLPVTDLTASIRFYEALGFVNEPRFTDETAACMKWSDAIAAMLVTRPRWATFTDRPIADQGTSEVALCLSCETREEVNAIVESGAAAGGMIDVNPPQDHGFMTGRSVADPDGHIWETMWMDPAVASGEAQPQVAA